MIRYVDTSAVLKLLIREAETEPLVAEIRRWQAAGDALVSSYLLHIELHCAAKRRGFADRETIERVLDAFELIDIERAHILAASAGEDGLRSLDALHLAVALSIEAEVLVAYDAELLRAAKAHSVDTSCPGAA